MFSIRTSCGLENTAPDPILAFGLLSWYGYCGKSDVLACRAANYVPVTSILVPSTTVYPNFPSYYWSVFRQPNCYPMRLGGVIQVNWLYGWVGSSYGQCTSYTYRRSNAGFYGAGYSDRRTLEQMPTSYMGCAQQMALGGIFYSDVNYTHNRGGLNVAYRDGTVRWLSMTTTGIWRRSMRSLPTSR